MNIIKEYWVQLLFLIGILGTFITFIKSVVEASQCSLRNDILGIYDRCKKEQKITQYQLESIQYSASLYFKLKGNSFVQDIMKQIQTFEVID